MDGQPEPPAWRKSRRSASGNCVELRIDSDAVGMRNSRQPDVELSFDRQSFADFLDVVKGGGFGLP
jgi:hypothetical protein